MVRLEGLEPPTCGSEDRRSNPLSYRRILMTWLIIAKISDLAKSFSGGFVIMGQVGKDEPCCEEAIEDFRELRERKEPHDPKY